MITMKRILTIIALVIATLPAFAQKQKNTPAGMRMEIVEIEQDDNEYSIFTYKDDDGTFGYYLSLGHVYRLLEVTRNDETDFTLDHVNETCLWLGADAEEASATIETLLELFDAPLATIKEFPCRLSTGAERLGESSIASCSVVKRLLQGKRLCFMFQSGGHTVQADLTKSALKSLRVSFNLHKKMHKDK